MNETKRCSRCHRVRDLADFPHALGKVLRVCSQCRDEPPQGRRLTQRRAWLKHKYGISLEEYDAMLRAQNGACAICGQPCSTGRQLAVDHDHMTGVVRALLCLNCNRNVGQFENQRQTMEHYLAAYGSGNPVLREKRGPIAPSVHRGEANRAAKLTEDQVVEIRQRYAAGGITQRRLGEEYGIHRVHVNGIIRGHDWSHVAT
ncbi:endonuclease domain-containing protein [Streptomyces sp. NPDC059340]|uniref:endonuclease domain-containing protein n=1 Tax=Streptomyces sp. NPDC059340 TaxID=3346806 RepID=UPI0036C991AC